MSILFITKFKCNLYLFVFYFVIFFTFSTPYIIKSKSDLLCWACHKMEPDIPIFDKEILKIFEIFKVVQSCSLWTQGGDSDQNFEFFWLSNFHWEGGAGVWRGNYLGKCPGVDRGRKMHSRAPYDVGPSRVKFLKIF